MKQFIGGLMILALFFSLSTLAQDKAMQKEEKKSNKSEMTKSETTMGPLKSVSCDPSCGFMVRGHNEKELVSIVKAHAKKMHNMSMTDKQVKDMMKTEESPATAK